MYIPLKYKLQELNLSGEVGKKQIVLLKIEEDVDIGQMKSLQEEIKKVREEAGWTNVVFLCLPKHISLTQLSDEDLDNIGLARK
jgi:hypothetical protein